jgi:hypothetical protein
MNVRVCTWVHLPMYVYISMYKCMHRGIGMNACTRAHVYIPMYLFLNDCMNIHGYASMCTRELMYVVTCQMYVIICYICT